MPHIHLVAVACLVLPDSHVIFIRYAYWSSGGSNTRQYWACHHACFGSNNCCNSWINKQVRLPLWLVSIISIRVVWRPLFTREGIQRGEVGRTVARIVQIGRDTPIREFNLILRREGTTRRPLVTVVSTWVEEFVVHAKQYIKTPRLQNTVCKNMVRTLTQSS